jgi:hypothetical protein
MAHGERSEARQTRLEEAPLVVDAVPDAVHVAEMDLGPRDPLAEPRQPGVDDGRRLARELRAALGPSDRC